MNLTESLVKDMSKKKSNDKLIENIVYTCKYCGNNYGELESAEHHLGQCLFNYDDNRACYTCKHAVEVKVAPYPNNKSDYNDWGVLKYLGQFDYIKCGLTGEQQTESQLLDKNRDCWEKFDNQQMNQEKTPEYLEHEQLINDIVEEEFAFGEYFKEEGYKEVNK